MEKRTLTRADIGDGRAGLHQLEQRTGKRLTKRNMKTKPQRGRPPKETIDKQSVRIRTNVTPSEAQLIARCAADDGLPLAEWSRQILIAAAKRRAR